MNKRIIPATGEQVPVIGLGTWKTFDVGPSEEERSPLREVLQLFVDKGGKLIDSSPMYGQSEEVVGTLAKSLDVLEPMFLATKVWTSGEHAGRQQLERSMQHLKKKPVDLMQVHNLVDYDTHLRTLLAMKDQGSIRYIGITHYSTTSYHALAQIMKKDPIDFVQFNYSLQTREAERYLLPLAMDRKIAVIVNRPFESGSLFSRVKGKSLPPWAEEFDCRSWGQFFLKYILSHPAVTCVIPATAKAGHMDDNLHAGFGKIPDEAIRKKMIEYFASM